MDATQSVRVGHVRVHFAALVIEGPDGRVSVEPKVMDALQVLAGRPGDVVSRAELLDTVWSENYGGDESLSRAVSLLRKAFGEVGGGSDYIETVPKRGYRLTPEVANLADVVPAPADVAPEPLQPGGGAGAKLPLAILAAVLVIALTFWFAYLAPDDSARSGGEMSPAQPAAVETDRTSIAVLPFANLSGDTDQQYLSDGLAEEILNALVQFPDLRVTGRQSSFKFRERGEDLAELNSSLGVSHVLTGSVRRQGNRVRVTARLVETRSGFNLWSESFDGELEDIFDLQEDIARKIAQTLGVVLDLPRQQRLAPELTSDRQAYALYLQGRALARKFGHRNKSKARELLQQAVTLDPQFAAAWAWLGQSYIYLTLTERSRIPELMALAREAIDTALNLDPGLAIGHYARTILLDYQLDFAGSFEAMEKAYSLSPNQPFIATRRGYYHALIGHSREGAAMIEQGLRWDPTDAIGLLNLGMTQQALGNLDAAASYIRRSEDLGFEPAALQVCVILGLQQEAEAAEACWNALSTGVRSRYQPALGQPGAWPTLAAALFGDDAAARQQIAARLDSYLSQPDSQANSYLTSLYPRIGAPERFIEVFLSRPFPLNAGALIGIWDDDPQHRALRQHPDFPAFVARIGLLRAWETYGWPDKCHKLMTTGDAPAFTCD